jgi:hypothetical protein
LKVIISFWILFHSSASASWFLGFQKAFAGLAGDWPNIHGSHRVSGANGLELGAGVCRNVLYKLFSKDILYQSTRDETVGVGVGVDVG